MRYSEGWKELKHKLESHSAQSPLILYYSGLIESRQPKWFLDAEKADYLKAPLKYYQITSSASFLPWDPARDEQKEYMNNVIMPQVEAAEKVMLICRIGGLGPGNGSDADTLQYFKTYFSSRNIKVISEQRFGYLGLLELGK